MKVHEVNIHNYKGNLSELAVEIGDLRYDALAAFLSDLAIKIAADGEKDLKRGRVKLAQRLSSCSKYISESAREIEEAWIICEPYTKGDN